MANKHLKVGIGGRRCACCFPGPGTVERFALYRRAKRRERQAALREALTDATLAAEEAWAAELKETETDWREEERWQRGWGY